MAAKIKANQIAVPPSAEAYRNTMNKDAGRFVDQIDRALMTFLGAQTDFCTLPAVPVSNLQATGPVAAPLILACYPQWIASAQDVPDDRVALSHGFPVSKSAMSLSTPTKPMVEQKYVARTLALVDAFHARPTDAQRPSTKRGFWYGTRGRTLRLANRLLHYYVTTQQPQVCVRCHLHRTVKRCLLCGLALCDEEAKNPLIGNCFVKFHDEGALPVGLLHSLGETPDSISSSLVSAASAALSSESAASPVPSAMQGVSSIPFPSLL